MKYFLLVESLRALACQSVQSLPLPTDFSKMIGLTLKRENCNNRTAPIITDTYVCQNFFPEPKRIWGPGSMFTMDFRPDRLNIKYDFKSFKITYMNYG